MADIWRCIGNHIGQVLNQPFAIDGRRPVGGGCISAAYVITGRDRRYFAKLHDIGASAMFEAEAEGLKEIAASGTLRVPRPLCWGAAENHAYLVMEYIEQGAQDATTAEVFGRQLAAMHRVARPKFGWRIDNHIGATRQVNTPETHWVAFWQRHRLGFQLALAASNGHSGRLQVHGERLLQALPLLFKDYTPVPALLHGDLWSGNWTADRNGTPVVFDPAVYYGDREADLAMTELFGGFPPAFYRAYSADYPLDAGYRVRKALYNLYHVLNHLNLFGAGYLSQAQRMIDGLLSEVG